MCVGRRPHHNLELTGLYNVTQVGAVETKFAGFQGDAHLDSLTCLYRHLAEAFKLHNRAGYRSHKVTDIKLDSLGTVVLRRIAQAYAYA